ncbi:hypothetical protein [Amorphus orientalis]|uniref:Uncharacterized protein n=1 Tax=Amorphus orientalis TaxID=649198 RepID=A0AAE3VTB5_9HYPH|nr:hypothetical protein [Amorphus orientalis]MDQ0317783.1 hypothetical protein [Amorphus orientalis]
MSQEVPENTAPAHPEFAKRFKTACDNYSQCPPMQKGRLVWIRDNLESRFNISVKGEAVRKWHSGIAIPRPKTLSALAKLLHVDDGWLAFGLESEVPSAERKSRLLSDDGAANIVVGFIQMSGGYCAFPEDGDPDWIDFYAILRAKQRKIMVCPYRDGEGDSGHFEVPNEHRNGIALGVFRTGPTSIDLFVLPSEWIEEFGEPRGPFITAPVKHSGKKCLMGGKVLMPIQNVVDELVGSLDRLG